MDLVRFFTAGNVDDGKSTLIGRLLYDSQSISTDIIETLTRQSKTTAENSTIDLALLTDGLRAEREQGITIDVAYKYFATENRKYIIADTPGHAQYTRNMFTGASTADVAILLVDARNGITDQTKRHTIIAATLGIPNVLVCINKMDLVEFEENRYLEIKKDFEHFVASLKIGSVSYLPAAALTGDNVVHRSKKMNWYAGPSLFEFLEKVEIEQKKLSVAPRFQVQMIIRPQTTDFHDYRGYAGTVSSGQLNVGDGVTVLPSGFESQIVAIEKNQQKQDFAIAGEPVVIHLADNIDVSRGNTIVSSSSLPHTDKMLEATICWMDNTAFQTGQKLLIQHNSFRTKAVIREVYGKIDIHTNEQQPFDGTLKLNELAKVSIKTAESISYDHFKDNPQFGRFILINEHSNQTVAAGVIGN